MPTTLTRPHGSATQGVLSTPTPGTRLLSTSVKFSWTPSNINTHYEFYVGTSVGSSNLYGSGNVTATTETVSDLPSNGETLYMRLYTLINGAWQYTDYTYVASGSPAQAVLNTPKPGTTLSGTRLPSRGFPATSPRTSSSGWARTLAPVTCITLAM